MWEHDLHAAMERLAFPVDGLFDGAEITAGTDARALLTGIVDARRSLGHGPTAIAVSSVLAHEGLPIESIYGIQLVFDETVPVGVLEIRSALGSRRVERFYTPKKKASV